MKLSGILGLGFFACSYSTKFIKNYSLGQGYQVLVGETMVEYKYARVQRFQSQIDHVVKVYDKHRIVLMDVEPNELTLSFHKDFENGNYVGYRAQSRFKISKLPRKIEFQGFTFLVKTIGKETVSYIILDEAQVLKSEPGIFTSAPLSSGKKGDNKGLPY